MASDHLFGSPRSSAVLIPVGLVGGAVLLNVASP